MKKFLVVRLNNEVIQMEKINEISDKVFIELPAKGVLSYLDIYNYYSYQDAFTRYRSALSDDKCGVLCDKRIAKDLVGNIGPYSISIET